MCLCKKLNEGMATGVPMSYLHSTLRSEMYVCVVHAIKLGYGYVYVCHFAQLLNRQLLVCVCIYTYVNAAEKLQIHKFILMLIMKYFI